MSRQGYITGLRGVAVLAVLLFHAGIWTALPAGSLVGWLELGHCGVDLFFVISGFCMFWPIVKAGDGRVAQLRVGPYLRRRAYRIAPPFYVAIVLVIGTSLLMWRDGGPSLWAGSMQSVFPVSAPQLAGNLITHVTFTHGFFPSYDRSIDGAFWSLSSEWQFYVVLPFLVMIGRRRSAFVAAGIGVIVAAAYIAVTHVVDPGFTSTAVGGDLVLGRLAEFGVGMAAAFQIANRRPVPPTIVSIALVAVAAYVDHAHPGTALRSLTWALAFGSLVASSSTGRLQALAEWQPLRRLGDISYSAYLVHGAVFMALAVPMTRANPSTTERAALIYLVGIPLALLVATVLHRVVELPAQRWSHDRRDLVPAAPQPSQRRTGDCESPALIG
jgi:peptidoglycan/LPS O-acetylase OafA/YrhL